MNDDFADSYSAAEPVVKAEGKLVPANTQLAAKRGFIRTASQSLATSLVIPGGITLALTQDFALAVLLGAGSMVASAIINGLQSYFSILGQGIPEDYAPEIEAN